MVENALQGSSPPQAGTAAIAAIKAYMREHITLLQQTAKLFGEAQKHLAAKKTAVEVNRWTKALTKLTAASYPPNNH